ncbi:hypothetical protein ACIQLJ_11935 [Microbacterium sp. NPDC091313]
MRNKILLIGAVAVAAYVLGSRAHRPQIANRESVGHQLVRLWDDPKARRRRRRARARAEKRVAKAFRDLKD